ncbi:hypothetical protein [Treponema bryantii]|uniref:hypothetical protein n=1 Tax=Treponema bryantii TaxID=163 RepID=UPI002B28CDB4|nr:hypothetical protein TRBR_01960 [Treponema bryantii]
MSNLFQVYQNYSDLYDELVNPEEAAKTMGAFFGDSMKNDIIQKQLNVIKEYTGIYYAGNAVK